MTTAIDEAAGGLVTANPPTVTSDCCRILNTLLGNLAREDSEKYRRINLANAKIKAAVVSAKFAVDFLRACGFEDAGAGVVEMRGADASARAAAGQAALDDACAQNSGPLLLGMRLPLDGVRACCSVGENMVATGSTDNGVRIWSSSPPLTGDPEPITCLVEHEGIRGAPARLPAMSALTVLPTLPGSPALPVLHALLVISCSPGPTCILPHHVYLRTKLRLAQSPFPPRSRTQDCQCLLHLRLCT